MDFRGLNQFTLLDFPGRIACVLFAGGCNFRCGYCHNPYLVLWPDTQPLFAESAVLAFLRARAGRLDGVVISGGEATLQPDLPDFLAQVKALGYYTRLDTNGSQPARLAACLERDLLDAVGLDYKAPAARYATITCAAIPQTASQVATSIRQVLAHGLPLEVRTTVHRHLLKPADLQQMRQELDELGVGEWVLQQFHPAEMIQDQLTATPTYTDAELSTLAQTLGRTRVRGLAGTMPPQPASLASA